MLTVSTTPSCTPTPAVNLCWILSATGGIKRSRRHWVNLWIHLWFSPLYHPDTNGTLIKNAVVGIGSIKEGLQIYDLDEHLPKWINEVKDVRWRNQFEWLWMGGLVIKKTVWIMAFLVISWTMIAVSIGEEIDYQWAYQGNVAFFEKMRKLV